MKKAMIMILALLLTLSLAACGGKKAPAPAGQTAAQTQSAEKAPAAESTSAQEQVTVPEGYEKCVNQGAVILYPTDKYEKSIMSGIVPVGEETPWIRLSISADAFDQQKALCQQEHEHSSDYSLTELTVGEHKALKCIYSDSLAYFMEVIIDTSFINDPFWSCVTVKVEVLKSEADMSVFEDATVWEIINSFYFDSSLKYNY